MEKSDYSKIIAVFLFNLKKEFSKKKKFRILTTLEVHFSNESIFNIDGSTVKLLDERIMFNLLDDRFYYHGESPACGIWSKILFQISEEDLAILPEALRIAMIRVARSKKMEIIHIESSSWLTNT